MNKQFHTQKRSTNGGKNHKDIKLIHKEITN